jgi:hypothetical protein
MYLRCSISRPILLAAVLAGCQDATAPTPVLLVRVRPPSVVMVIGTSLPFIAEVMDSAGNVLPNRPVAWRSSDTTAVKVSPTGVASALSLGVVSLTATSGGVSGSATVYSSYICTCSPPGPAVPTTASACSCAP